MKKRTKKRKNIENSSLLNIVIKPKKVNDFKKKLSCESI